MAPVVMHFAFHVKNGDCNLHWTALVAHQPEEIFLPESASNSHFDFHRPEAVSQSVNYHSRVWSPGFGWFVVTAELLSMCGLRAKAVLGGTEDAGRNHLPYVAKGRRTLTKPESHGRLCANTCAIRPKILPAHRKFMVQTACLDFSGKIRQRKGLEPCAH